VRDEWVQINDPVIVGPTNSFNEIPVLPDDGSWAGPRTARGGILYSSYGDGNPERIIVDDAIVSIPGGLNVGDHFAGSLTGVVDYNFGLFMVELTQTPTRVPGLLTKEATAVPTADQLAVATFNVENLDPTDPPSKFAALAGLMVNNLRSPDLLAIEEIQDNNGPSSVGSSDATLTWQMLIAAITAAGGPTYDYRQIDPLFNQDGGEPNGNIRQGFLFRTDRGLSFVDRPGGTATTATHEDASRNGAQLTLSPGRIDPNNAAFTNSRKPLVGEFRWRGKTFFAIANHFNSKGGDDPLLGRYQPPQRASETQRHQQAAIVNAFVDELIAADKQARVVVLGDLNDFEFSDTLAILKGGVLVNLMETLPAAERYSYVFEGNSQVLDQILVSPRLFKAFESYDSVHVNAEFANQDSDHDPQVTRLRFGQGVEDEQ
jgi:predicted extracellular nuclease